MDFREADRRYASLRQQYDSGNLSDEQFRAQLEQLMVQDSEGRWWSKHRETGAWHYYDGSNWVRGTPPGEQGSAATRSYQPEDRPRDLNVPGQPGYGGEAGYGAETTPGYAAQVRAPGASVPGYLLPASIAATLLCCLPTGIVAIIYSTQARSKSQAGDTAGASQATRNANIWLIVSVVAGLLAWVVYLVAAGSGGV